MTELHQTVNVHHISQLLFFLSFSKPQASMAVEIMQFIQPRCGSEEFGRARQSRAKLHGSVKALWLNLWRTSGGATSNTCEEHMDTCKAGAASSLGHEQRLWFREPPDSESGDGRPTSESDSDDFHHGALMDRNNQRDHQS